MAWALVTPASRGIGFALTGHLLRTLPASVPVVATARSDVAGVREKLLALSPGLSESQSSRLDVQGCDVLSEPSISRLARYCQERYHDKRQRQEKTAHLRIGFVIPGMLIPERAPDKIEYERALQTLKLNLLAPMMLVKHFASFLPRKSTQMVYEEGTLPRSAVLALMSARVGSIGDNRLGGWYSYRASKAGVNQVVKSTDIFLEMQSGHKAMCVGLHPGTVKTSLSREFWDSTPPERLFSPEFSAQRLIDVVYGLEESSRGKCWDWKGQEIPP
ncbi:uncharacterized protein Z519_02569 [Cladophialophora bantiana CBS 173.52]|uniref:Uncharacterized protein n=1 Tax=Cladophialophora bantiana (strain ATCC 10958 / CBS 173.52 / CDC B-1940 / NIH 8579) TaxID=1442370 RepID=A0A0D2GFM3_CLAB1|nr:uncharacterized protein Z519_02569 [Cladophialophora bantiana CBS 173.52]KIW97177.1 hypothetical protein Z519_02569 [Cladophialophora bantiana CBS 173.52]